MDKNSPSNPIKGIALGGAISAILWMVIILSVHAIDRAQPLLT
jgi:hypothetical protein